MKTVGIIGMGVMGGSTIIALLWRWLSLRFVPISLVSFKMRKRSIKAIQRSLQI